MLTLIVGALAFTAGFAAGVWWLMHLRGRLPL